MEWLRCFSDHYANAVTAAAAIAALVLTFFTLLFLRREYRAKYRPYVTARLYIQPFNKDLPDWAYDIFIRPKNVGPHPCRIKISGIELDIGNETFTTGSLSKWTLIGSHDEMYGFPAGHINALGVEQVRSDFYPEGMNKVLLRFTLHSISIENEHETAESFLFQIDLAGEKPIPVYLQAP